MLKNLLVLITIIVFLGYYYFTVSRENYFQVHFLDVGQGDSILLVTPDKEYILIDGGPSGHVIEQLGQTIPFWQNTLDYVVATHGDADHVTGLVDVLERYNVENFIYNGEQKNTLVYKKLMYLVEKRNSNTIQATSETDFLIGCCLYIDMMWPHNGYEEGLGSNDSSVAFIASYGEFDVYLAGDLSSQYEIQMLSGRESDIEIHKTSHHGSKTSSPAGLFELINPEISIISAAEDNRYGHPHSEVLTVLEREKIQVYRTDHHGKISIFSDGKDYFVKTERVR